MLSSVGKELSPSLAVLMGAETKAVFDFLAMRKLLEGWCAAQAAEVAQEEDLDRLAEVLDRMRRVGFTDAEWEKLDVEFHLAVAAASRNVVAVHLMEAIKQNFNIFFSFRQRIKEPDRSELMYEHHHVIYQAIVDGDGELARRKLEDHLNYIAGGIRTNLEKIRG